MSQEKQITNKQRAEAKDRAFNLHQSLEGIEAIVWSMLMEGTDSGFYALGEETQYSFIRAVSRLVGDATKEARTLKEELEAML